MSVFTILLGGDVYVTDRLKKQVAGSRVIAADSGIRHAKRLELVPYSWVGDFDSCPNWQDYITSDIQIDRYHENKDKTDGELAIDKAIACGAKKLILCGAFGGERLDHIIAHMTMALRYCEQGYEVILTSGKQEAIPIITSEQKINWKAGTCFSILSFSKLGALVIRGAKWNLDGSIDIPCGSTHTLSNVVVDNLYLKLGSGKAIVLATF